MFQRVFMVPQFEGELKKLFGKSKKELDNYKFYLLSKLQFIDQTDQHFSDYPFEHLHDDRADLFRIRSKSNKKNVRVIYYYRIDESIILLCAFEEKSPSDYQNNITIALKRIKEIERE